MGHPDMLENMMGKLGDFGRYQCLQFMLQTLSGLPTGMHMISLVTITAVPDHRCAIEGLDSENYTEPWNFSRIFAAIPSDKKGNLDSCTMYTENQNLTECSSWVYDTKYFTSSRGIEMNFVCNQRWKGAVTQSAFMCGVILGSLVIAPLCDKFGRKTVFCWSSIFQLITSIAVAFTTDYISFTVMRFICGIFAISPFKAAYVLFIELIGQSKRNIGAAIFQLLFGVGVMLVGVWGYLIDNRFYLQLTYALHTALLLPHCFLMDESPRWLWAKGRIGQSTALIEKALKMNQFNVKIDAPLLISNHKSLCAESVPDKTASVLDLFRTPNLLKKTLIICGSWFAIAVVYYGLSLNTGKLNGNPFFMLIISGLVELPGYMIAMYFVSKLGNRSVLSGTMLCSGIALLSAIFLPFESTASTAAVMVGKMFISGTFAIIYKYAAELFPTVVRSSGIGFGTMCASVASALTPLITLLDSFDPTVPTTVFGIVSIFFGLCALLLPETLGRRLPQTLADGENFGIGETCFTHCREIRLIETSVDSIGITEPVNEIVHQ